MIIGGIMEINIVNSLDEMAKLFSRGQLAIYGAGKVSKVVMLYAMGIEKTIDSIIVTKKNGNPDRVLGVKVKQLDEIGLDQFVNLTILICVYERLQGEIISTLEEYGVGRCCIISDELINQLQYHNATFELEILQTANSIEKRLCEITKNIEYAEKRLESLVKNIDKTVLWKNSYERSVVRANWIDYLESDDFQSLYLDLINGLDAESISTINQILSRQRLYLYNDNECLDLYSPEEQQELIKQKNSFYNEILKISDDLFAYKNYLLKRNVFEVSVFYYKNGIHMIKHPERICGKNIIDVGGYVGDSVLVLEDLNPDKIFSFEALPDHVEEMKYNLEMNKIDNCIIVNSALGDYEGSVTVHCNGSISTMIDRKSIKFINDVDVPITTLDNYIENNKISNVGLIKVDIEGAEPYFLKGAEKTIRKWKPILLISIYHNGHDFFMLKPMIEKWNLGYKFRVFKPTNGNISNETLLIAETD